MLKPVKNRGAVFVSRFFLVSLQRQTETTNAVKDITPRKGCEEYQSGQMGFPVKEVF